MVLGPSYASGCHERIFLSRIVDNYSILINLISFRKLVKNQELLYISFLFYIFTDILRQSCPAHQLQYAYAIYFRLNFHNFNVEPSPQKNYIVLDQESHLYCIVHSYTLWGSTHIKMSSYFLSILSRYSQVLRPFKVQPSLTLSQKNDLVQLIKILKTVP